MKIIDFIRLIRKHIVLLVLVPVLLGGLVTMMTRKPSFTYTSQTVLFTGLATGSSIEMDKSFNYFATNTAFDNLLNIINSRKTQQEVAIRLLSQHLLLEKPDAKYISAQSYAELQQITPPSVYKHIIRNSNVPNAGATADTTSRSKPDSLGDHQKQNLFPSGMNRAAYEQTVQNLTALMNSSDTNFVYKLLNFDHPHYSIKAISSIKAMRIGTSDLVKLTYEVNDPGICQQTLAIYNEVCTKNYKAIRENRSDDVVKYFEGQLNTANDQLKTAEDKLLEFNKSNNIINYYEQSKAVAVVKEDMEMDYSNKKAQLAGHEAAIKRLEEKLNIQQLVQLKSNNVLVKKKQLGDLNYEIANAEADETTNAESRAKLPGLRKKAEELENDIRKTVDELYAYQNTTDGLPVSKVLSEWINNVIEAENLRAKILVMDQRNREFQQQYSIYAPAGAHIKRIEREINVSEQGYLEILHGLNLAKLKLQDNELASDLRTVDPPFYPLSPNANKRKVLIIASAFLGILLVLGAVLLMEYFDSTLRNGKKAEKMLQLVMLGMIPKIYRKPGITSFPVVQTRLLDIITQNIQQTVDNPNEIKIPKTIIVFSTLDKEGKSVLAGNICRRLKEQQKKILFLSPEQKEAIRIPVRRIPLLHLLLGYQDPRINYQDPFLQAPAAYLQPQEYKSYPVNEQLLKATQYKDLLQGQQDDPAFTPDYVLIELPALLSHNYSSALVTNADLNVLVCRSNRNWSDADQTALNTFQNLVGSKLKFILNGVEVQELESLLGELPKKRSLLRRKLKNLFRFQFFSKNQF